MNIDAGMVLVKKQDTLHTEEGKTCLLGVPIRQQGVKGKPGTDWPVTTWGQVSLCSQTLPTMGLGGLLRSVCLTCSSSVLAESLSRVEV